MFLDDRKKLILKIVIEEYIRLAEPVGSRHVAERLPFAVSSATIRNELADLEAMGMLEHPHTSAGRIPTHKGYRVYVNHLMRYRRLNKSETAQINRALDLRMDALDELLSEASRAVSTLTKYTSVAVTPKAGAFTLHRLEIIPYDAHSFVLVVVTGEGLVKNKLCRVTGELSPDALWAFTDFVNRRLYRADLARENVETLLPGDLFRGAESEIAAEISSFLNALAREWAAQDVFYDGAANLLAYPEYRNLDRMKELWDFLADTSEVSGLSPPGDNILAITIGDENRSSKLKDSSVVTATYRIGSRARGFIGVIGPTRMDYPAVAARLDYFAKGLSRVLGDLFEGGGIDGDDDIITDDTEI